MIKINVLTQYTSFTDFQGVTKKVKRELIKDYRSKTSDEKFNDRSSERKLSTPKKKLQKLSQKSKMNETYIVNKQTSRTSDSNISSEKFDNDLGSSLGKFPFSKYHY